jgi:hypothetical protein
MWSRGYVPIDTIEVLEDDRDYEVKQNREERLDWDYLRKRVQNGIRNATVMMIAPNGNSSLTAGTSPGIDPRFALVFSRTTMNGKFLDINENLVNELKELELWEEVREDLLASQGDISQIEAVPDELKEVYKTSFQIDPSAFVKVASRAQKWIDQSMSRNMYLSSRDPEDNMEVYIDAWKRGLKTTYYLHMKPRHTAEQSSVKVNKAKSIVGKKGFGEVDDDSNENRGEKKEKGDAASKKEGSSEQDGRKKKQKQELREDKSENLDKKKYGFGKARGFGKLKKKSKKSETPKEKSAVKAKVEVKSGSGIDKRETAKKSGFHDDRKEHKNKKSKGELGNLLDACPVDPIERMACDSCG